ncbi:Uncharacterised protein [Mycobacterium tuberculosis]|nr:Uncharacterised protein [Mycobacterium tuberculosis]
MTGAQQCLFHGDPTHGATLVLLQQPRVGVAAVGGRVVVDGVLVDPAPRGRPLKAVPITPPRSDR